MRQMEVRCCCQPKKLLGWLPVPDDAGDGSLIRFAIAPVFSMVAPLEMTQSLPAEVIALPVATFFEAKAIVAYPHPNVLTDYSRDNHLALKSEETPIEKLRRIKGFQEAPNEP